MAFVNALFNLWPEGDKLIPGLRDGIANAAPIVFPKYGIEPELVIAHLMAQISLECNAGMEVVENLNYSPQRLPQVWPSHFNASNAIEYAHNPQKLANYIYEPPLHNDLGNIAKSNDGWNFRGRGATQTTGRGRYVPTTKVTKTSKPIYEGYTGLQAFLVTQGVQIDLVNNPDLINNPLHFLECGVADFILCGCLPWAKQDNVTMVTEKLNGGHEGLADRITWLHRWKAVDLDLS
jgi:putative chitinase